MGDLEDLRAEVERVTVILKAQASHLADIRRLIADLQRRVRVLENGSGGAGGGSPDARRCVLGLALRASGPKQEARGLFRAFTGAHSAVERQRPARRGSPTSGARREDPGGGTRGLRLPVTTLDSHSRPE
jgi:hypothetical protein